MVTPLKLLLIFIIMFQLSLNMINITQIYPGILLNTGAIQNAYYGSTSDYTEQQQGMANSADPNNNPTSTFNLFGMGWVFKAITVLYNTIICCTVGGPAFYTNLFSLVTPNLAEAQAFGFIVGSMQGMAVTLGLASLVMRWNI